MNKAHLKIVKDLTRKYPKGPKGDLTKDDYVVTDHWSRTHNKYRQTSKLRQKSGIESRLFGYTPEILVKIYENHHLIEDYVRGSSDTLLSNVAISRRVNLVSERLSVINQHAKERGIIGVYKVSWGYNDYDRIYMFGSSKREVRVEASILNGSFGKDITEEPDVRFMKTGTAIDAGNLNKEKIENSLLRQEQRVARVKKEYESADQKLQELRQRASFLLSISSNENES